MPQISVPKTFVSQKVKEIEADGGQVIYSTLSKDRADVIITFMEGKKDKPPVEKTPDIGTILSKPSEPAPLISNKPVTTPKTK